MFLKCINFSIGNALVKMLASCSFVMISSNLISFSLMRSQWNDVESQRSWFQHGTLDSSWQLLTYCHNSVIGELWFCCKSERNLRSQTSSHAALLADIYFASAHNSATFCCFLRDQENTFDPRVNAYTWSAFAVISTIVSNTGRFRYYIENIVSDFEVLNLIFNPIYQSIFGSILLIWLI